ncbi:MAG: glycosyltransferase [Thermoguttaceae bacterium]
MLSIILPVGENSECLETTIRSVCLQTNTDWELLAVDFAAKDRCNETLQERARRDERIHVAEAVANGCPAVARNTGLKLARGELIAYLDPGDEYYPDYLAEVIAAGQQGDVLLFRFDIGYEDGPANGRPTQWDPGQVIDKLFAQHIVPPLGVAHRRSILPRVGVFNELLWQGEDWEFLKRLARLGLRFRIMPHKCGRHSELVDKANRQRMPTPFQAATLTANRRAGKPIFRVPNVVAPPRKVERIAFVSPHCLLDFTNGAATATLDQLQLLQRVGFQCRAFCGSQCDVAAGTAIEDVLEKHSVPHRVASETIGSLVVPLIQATYQGVSTTVVQSSAIDRSHPNSTIGRQFLAACDAFLHHSRPDVVLTYGGGPLPVAIHDLVKARDIPLVFELHNFGYGNPRTFHASDYAIVPTEYCKRHYWDTLGLACLKLPLVINPDRVLAQSRQPRFLTFVNPEPRKGVFVFARIAEMLAGRRPDIPILIVDGKQKFAALPALGIDLSRLKNISVMENTPDPRRFFAVTRVLLMPSLSENFGFVAGEAMLNGIPVLASNRGGLPETVGNAGLLIDIPARHTPETRDISTAEDVRPWVETIIRLWDDEAEYERWSLAARKRSEQWHPDRLAPVYCEFFSHLTHQPGPPLVPREGGKQGFAKT